MSGKKKGPKPIYPFMDGRPFLNPYNFVPVVKDGPIADHAEATRHTGYFVCSLTVRTPLAVPDHEYKTTEGEVDTYPFMTVDGKRMIPGSSIRGSIRSIYETATDSCMMIIDDDILGISNVRKPCNNRKKLCEACALFGMVENKTAFGSKVRFTDAECVKYTGSDPAVQLKELSSPKPEKYLPFYTEGGAEYDAEGTCIRGRKYYWHNPRAAWDSAQYMPSPGADTSRSAKMELVHPGTVFRFRVYYDGIAAEQRDRLAWALTLDEGDGIDRCIKLGHGKSIGLGSVKITIDGAGERSVADDGYQVSSEKMESITGWIRNGARLMRPCKPNAKAGDSVARYEAAMRRHEDLLRITNYNAVPGLDQKDEKDKKDGLEIRYPYVYAQENTDAKLTPSFKWFIAYRKKNRTLPTIDKAVERPLHPVELKYKDENGNIVNSKGEPMPSEAGHQDTMSSLTTNSGEIQTVRIKRLTKGGENKPRKAVLKENKTTMWMLYEWPEKYGLEEGDVIRVKFKNSVQYDKNQTHYYSYIGRG